jgi:hypothetical protein
MPGAPTTDARVVARRFAAASATGGVLATIVFCWMITNARFDLFARQPFGEIHDAQARGLFHGRWDVPLEVVGIEGFRIDHKYYTYFGPFLAVLRMPVLLVSDQFDGRLTITSMLLALVVLLATASHLHWRLRSVLRGDRPFTTLETVAVAAFTFAIGAGSIVAFLASRGLVYHEVELWGIAWAMATTDALVGFAIRPSRGLAIAAGLCAIAAMMTRISVGAGAIVAVSLVALGQIMRRWWTERGIARFGPGPDPVGRWHIAVLLTGVAVAIVLYAGVNIARFGSPYELPLDKQVFTELDVQRQRALEENGGSLFGAKFAPTAAVQYARPDAIRASREFPWVDFPDSRATVVGDVEYDTVDRSSSLPASMPGFSVLAIVGLVALVRPRRVAASVDLARFWPPVVGGVVGTLFVLTIAYIAHRYLADFFPPVLFASMIGFQRVATGLERVPRPTNHTIAGVVLAVLFVAGAWISFGLGRVYQRPQEPGEPGARGVTSGARP